MGREPPPSVDQDGWRQHACAQRRAWLALSYRDRLRWLEQAKAFAVVARHSRRSRPTPCAEPDHASASSSAGLQPQASPADAHELARPSEAQSCGAAAPTSSVLALVEVTAAGTPPEPVEAG